MIKGTFSLGLAALAMGVSITAGVSAAAGAGRQPATSPAKTEPAKPGPTKPESAAGGYAAAADYSALMSGRAVLVMKAGQVVFERYDGGWSAERPHPLASGTKSFTGVMAMMAVQDGLLTLDEKVCDTITEWKNDPRRSGITVRHLLTLSSGLDANMNELESRGGSRLLGEGARLRSQRKGLDNAPPPPPDLAKASLKAEAKFDPGTKFEYGPTHFYVFCELLNRKLAAKGGAQNNTAAYLQARIFDALGIKVAYMGRDKVGNPNLPGGCLLTAREWAKFGQFVLRQGRAADTPEGPGKALLKPELLAQCFEASKSNKSYGLTWWLPAGGNEVSPVADQGGALGQLLKRRQGKSEDIKGPDGQPIKVFMAAGLGKQRLYVLPQFDLVVVRFAEATIEGQKFEDYEFLKRVVNAAK